MLLRKNPSTKNKRKVSLFLTTFLKSVFFLHLCFSHLFCISGCYPYHAMHMPFSFNYFLCSVVHPHFYCLLLSNMHNIRIYIHLSLNTFYFLFVSFVSSILSIPSCCYFHIFSHLVQSNLPKNTHRLLKIIPKQTI